MGQVSWRGVYLPGHMGRFLWDRSHGEVSMRKVSWGDVHGTGLMGRFPWGRSHDHGTGTLEVPICHIGTGTVQWEGVCLIVP